HPGGDGGQAGGGPAGSLLSPRGRRCVAPGQVEQRHDALIPVVWCMASLPPQGVNLVASTTGSDVSGGGSALSSARGHVVKIKRGGAWNIGQLTYSGLLHRRARTAQQYSTGTDLLRSSGLFVNSGVRSDSASARAACPSTSSDAAAETAA